MLVQALGIQDANILAPQIMESAICQRQFCQQILSLIPRS